MQDPSPPAWPSSLVSISTMDIAVYATLAAIVVALIGAGMLSYVYHRTAYARVKCIRCKHRQRVSAHRATYVCRGCNRKMRHHI